LIEPWVGPQPRGPVCGVCSVIQWTSTGQILWENRLLVDDETASNPTLRKPWGVKLFNANGADLFLPAQPYWIRDARETLWFGASQIDRIRAEVEIEFTVQVKGGGTAHLYETEVVPFVLR
jgi:hypothetical protein